MLADDDLTHTPMKSAGRSQQIGERSLRQPQPRPGKLQEGTGDPIFHGRHTYSGSSMSYRRMIPSYQASRKCSDLGCFQICAFSPRGS